MATYQIGKIRFTTDGVWDSTTTYSILSTVTNSDLTKVYVSKVDGNQGNQLSDTTKWQLILDADTAVANVTKKPIVTNADTSDTLQPNRMYEFGQVAAIDIGLSSPTANEYTEWQFSFNSGATATTFSVPSGVVWTTTVSIETNMHYEVNIVYNQTNQTYYGIIVGWDWTAPSE